MIIQYFDITESDLENREYTGGCLYCCSDTGRVFLDSVLEGKRVKIGTDIEVCATDLPLAPIHNTVYCVIKTGRLYIYADGEWIALGSRPQLHFKNVVVSGGTLTLTNSEILSTDTAQFIPDLSVEDLASNISAICTDGSVTVNLTSSYDIIGEVIVN